MEHQDYKVVTFGKPKAQIKQEKKNQPKKTQNDKGIAILKLEHKADNTDEPLKIVTVPREVSLNIQKIRCSKKIKRDDLAKKMNIPTKVLEEIENGKYKYDKLLINKILKYLQI